MKFLQKFLLVCCMIFSNNVFAMLEPQYLVSKLFLKKIDESSWSFDGSAIEIEFKNGYKIVICAEALDNLVQQFVAEINYPFDDIEIIRYCDFIMRDFTCNNEKNEIESFKHYCDTIIYFCENNPKIDCYREQYYNAISFVLGFLKMRPDETIEIFDTIFSPDECTKKLADFFDKAIRISIAKELFIIEDISVKKYLGKAIESEFNDPKFINFVLNVANKLALLVLKRLSKIEVGVQKTS